MTAPPAWVCPECNVERESGRAFNDHILIIHPDSEAAADVRELRARIRREPFDWLVAFTIPAVFATYVAMLLGAAW